MRRLTYHWPVSNSQDIGIFFGFHRNLEKVFTGPWICQQDYWNFIGYRTDNLKEVD
jgi:hypothetical protein